jgi:hypothetical protein
LINRAPLELPPEVAKDFVDDMRAFFAEPDGHERNAIAVRQLRALNEYRGPRERRLQLDDIKELFGMMRHHLGR